MEKKLFNKKAQGISLNVVIIAVIALLVLVVVVAIFSGKIAIFGKDVNSCKTLGGDCLTVTTCPTDSIELSDTTDCKGEDQKCCKKVY